MDDCGSVGQLADVCLLDLGEWIEAHRMECNNQHCGSALLVTIAKIHMECNNQRQRIIAKIHFVDF